MFDGLVAAPMTAPAPAPIAAPASGAPTSAPATTPVAAPIPAPESPRSPVDVPQPASVKLARARTMIERVIAALLLPVVKVADDPTTAARPQVPRHDAA